MAHLGLATIVVADRHDAIELFTDTLGFELVEDSTAVANDGRPKRWVVGRPLGARTGLLIAQADGDRRIDRVGDQTGGRVGFLQVDDFGDRYTQMRAAGVEFLTEPCDEPDGRVVMFRDVAGNRWGLLGPPTGREGTIGWFSPARRSARRPAEGSRRGSTSSR